MAFSSLGSIKDKVLLLLSSSFFHQMQCIYSEVCVAIRRWQILTKKKEVKTIQKMHFSINPRFYIVTSLYSVSSSDLFHNGSINVNFKLFLPPPLNGLHKIESISMCIKWEGCGSVFLT